MNKKMLTLILAAVVAVLLPVFVSNSYVINVLVLMLLYAVLSTSWNFVSGYAGQFGFGVFFAIGAYICAGLFNTFGLTPWLGMLIGAFVTSLIGLAMGFLTFNLSGPYFALSTLALLNILQIVFAENNVILGIKFGGTAGIRLPWIGGFWNMQFVDKRVYYYIILVILVLTLILSNYIAKSKPGFYFKAINTNQMAASSLGVNVLKYKQLAQFLTSFVMGMVGGFYVTYMSFVEPSSMFSFEIVFNIMLMALVGGRATVFGPTIGAMILMPLYALLRLWLANMPGLPTALFGVILVLSTMYMPGGLVPLITERTRARKIRAMQAAKKAASTVDSTSEKAGE